jgi:hypothetical protein
MSFGLQLEILWSYPSFLAAGAVVLAVVTQAWYEKRKRALEGRAPMVSHLIPWVGSALEVAADPDAFFDRARWVVRRCPFVCGCVVDLFLGKSTETCSR